MGKSGKKAEDEEGRKIGSPKYVFLELEGWEREKIESFMEKEMKAKARDVFLTSKTIQELSPEIYKNAEYLSVFIYSHLNKHVLSKMRNLKAVITRSSGYDHIDISYCKKKGIEVYNIPDYGDNTVAEHALMLILALLRNLKTSQHAIERMLNINHVEMRGWDLKGKTVGIIGTGRIGSYLIKLLQPFDVEILAYSRTRKEWLEKKYGVKYVSLTELLKRSDIISIHLPLTKETHHIINKRNIRIMKKGSYLINTSRGGVVETEALIYGLEKGILAGVGLDVIEGEEVLKEEKEVATKKFDFESLRGAVMSHALLKYDNVIITPHTAYNTWDALNRILNTTLYIIKNHSKKELPYRVV